MACVECEPIMGVRGRPQRGSGAEDLVRGLGGKAPMKLRAFLIFDMQPADKICPHSPYMYSTKNLGGLVPPNH